MALQTKNKVEISFSLASMTDLIFLLLIFFLLTSSMVSPAGLPVSLPSSKSSTIDMQKVSVTISKDLRYFVNDKEVTFEQIEPELASYLTNAEEGIVVLNVDKDVKTEDAIKVAGIAAYLKAKVSIAVQPSR
jgi:biopolymer transport protein ExbD